MHVKPPTDRQSAKHRLKKPKIVAISLVSAEIVQIHRSVPAWNCKFQLCNLSLRWLFAKVSLTGTAQEMM